MEPENTVPIETHTKRNFSLVALLAVLLIVGAIIIFLPRGNAPEKIVETRTAPAEKKTYTQAEKERILAQLSASLPVNTTSQAEKERILSNLAKRVPADSTSSEEKMRILAELAARAGQ